jgi:hypothetical protein
VKIMLMSPALVGLVAGFAATGCMTAWEVLFFRRYGLEACLDWDVNQHLISMVNRRSPEANLTAGLAMHFTVGIGVGASFGSFVHSDNGPSLVWIALVLGLVLWLLLLPMRRIARGAAPRAMPAIVSLVGHAIYGIVLAVTILHLRGQ